MPRKPDAAPAAPQTNIENTNIENTNIENTTTDTAAREEQATPAECAAGVSRSTVVSADMNASRGAAELLWSRDLSQ